MSVSDRDGTSPSGGDATGAGRPEDAGRDRTDAAMDTIAPRRNAEPRPVQVDPPVRTELSDVPVEASDAPEPAPEEETATPLRLHGTCVAIAGRGLLLRGPSGIGKSRLALHLMALGARLVADDMVELRRVGPPGRERLTVGCPPAGRGLIEARGLGLLHAAPSGPVPLAHVVDLETSLGPRLPPRDWVTFLRQRVQLHRLPPGIETAGALMQLMRAGRHA